MITSPGSPLIDVALTKMKKAIVCCELAPGEKLKVAELTLFPYTTLFRSRKSVV